MNGAPYNGPGPGSYNMNGAPPGYGGHYGNPPHQEMPPSSTPVSPYPPQQPALYPVATPTPSLPMPSPPYHAYPMQAPQHIHPHPSYTHPPPQHPPQPQQPPYSPHYPQAHYPAYSAPYPHGGPSYPTHNGAYHRPPRYPWEANAREEARRAFIAADMNRNNGLDVQEFRDVVTRLVGQVVPYNNLINLFGEVDKNQDGKISVEEFENLFVDEIAKYKYGTG